MPGESDIKAGEAYVEVTARDKSAMKTLTRFEKRWVSVGDTVQSVGSKLMKAAAFVGSALVASAVAWSASASEMVDAAARVGTTVEAISGLGYAADQTGSNIDDLENGMRTMQKTIAAAVAGSESATSALSDIGVSVSDLQRLAPEEQFRLIADRLKRIEDPAKRTASAMALLGKSGAKLIPLLSLGRAGIDALIRRGKEMGAVFDNDSAAAAEEFGDVLHDLKTVIWSNVFAIGGALVPELRALLDILIKGATSVRDFIKEHKAWVAAATGVVAVTAAIGAGLWILGGAMGYVGRLVGFTVPLLLALKAGLMFIVGAITLILSPVSLLTAAFVGLGAVLVTQTKAGGAALSWLGDVMGSTGSYMAAVITEQVGAAVAWLTAKFQSFATDAMEAWKGIGDAIAAGDLGLAARIAFGFVLLEGKKAYRALIEVWHTFKGWFVGIFTDAWYGAVIVAANAMAKIETWWAETVAFIGNVWDGFMTGFGNMIRSIVGGLKAAYVYVRALADKSINVDAEVTAIDRDTTDANATAQNDFHNRINERNKTKDDRVSQIERDRSDAESGAVVLADESKAKRQQEADAELAALQAEINNARGEYKQLLTTAADKRALAEGAAPNVLKPALAHVPEEVAAAKEAPKASGTFNAAAGFSLASESSKVDEVRKECERTANAVQTLLQLVRLRKLTFTAGSA